MARGRLEIRHAFEAEPGLRFEALGYARNNAVYTRLGRVEQKARWAEGAFGVGCGVPRYLLVVRPCVL